MDIYIYIDFNGNRYTPAHIIYLYIYIYVCVCGWDSCGINGICMGF